MHHKQTFVLPKELVQQLDEFAEKNMIKTRNQALTEVLKQFFQKNKQPKQEFSLMLNQFELKLNKIEQLIKELSEI